MNIVYEVTLYQDNKVINATTKYTIKQVEAWLKTAPINSYYEVNVARA